MRYASIVLVLFSINAIAGATPEARDYEAYCHGSIIDHIADEKDEKIEWNDDHKKRPIHFDLADFPGIDYVWNGAKVVTTSSFRVRLFFTGNTFWLSLNDRRNNPTDHIYNNYLLARASTKVADGAELSLSFASPFDNKMADVFVDCTLYKKK